MPRRYAGWIFAGLMLYAGSFVLSIRAQTKQISTLQILTEANPARTGVQAHQGTDWESNDWTNWSKEECEKILQSSSWADYWHQGPNYYTDPYTGEFIEDMLVNWEVTRFDSALPIRQAQLRLLQLKEQYHKMNPEEKSAFDGQHTKDLSEDDDAPVSISWTSDTGRKASARQIAIKLPDGSFVMPLQITLSGFRDFLGPNIANRGEYMFPRKVNGKPLFTQSDKEITLIFGAVLAYHGKTETLGPLNQKDFDLSFGETKTFSIPLVIYKGKLEY
jgi:hypothetical protein